ncbi:hypothetical protein SAMN05661012_04360 [Chitinophaga sancti]|uniref:Uncharacterized protein n=1 Tax=Chitinophaga sancti TaxID=1004 RepID=A0A1K1RXB8_9BACT|nr:hypothetical protein SAMN05661012_04360 [Chitinophaga sancti]
MQESCLQEARGAGRNELVKSMIMSKLYDISLENTLMKRCSNSTILTVETNILFKNN